MSGIKAHSLLRDIINNSYIKKSDNLLQTTMKRQSGKSAPLPTYPDYDDAKAIFDCEMETYGNWKSLWNQSLLETTSNFEFSLLDSSND